MAEPWEEVEPLIRWIVQQKLAVSLKPDDGQEENQDALDLLGKIREKLFATLAQASQEDTLHGIENFRKYAAVVAYHACAEHIRGKYRERTRLKNSLRYLLTRLPAYAVWQTEEGEQVCGWAHWRPQALAPVDKAQGARLCTAPLVLKAVPSSSREQWRRAEWQQLLNAIFDALPAPLVLDELVTLVATLLGVTDKIPEPPPHPPRPERTIETRQFWQRIWQAIQGLRPRYRVAYLLNPSGLEIEVFPWYGLASISDIGQALALTAAQYEVLWQALPLTEAERCEAQALRTPDEQFARLWRFLPLQDTLIAQMLGATRQQVINLRQLARDSMQKQLRDEVL